MRILLLTLLLTPINLFASGPELLWEDLHFCQPDTLIINDTTLMVVDTVTQTDTMVVYIDQPGMFSLVFQAFVSPSYSFDHYSFGGLGRPTLEEQINTEFSGFLNGELGCGFALNYRDYSLSGGLEMIYKSERVNHQPWNFITTPVTYQQLDTISIWGDVIDEDTSWRAETEWNTYIRYDTITIRENYFNRCLLLQVPLSLGKNFVRGNSEIRVSAGIAARVLLGRSSIAFLNEEQQLIEVNSASIRIFSFSYFAELDYMYKINDRLSLLTGIIYQRNRHPVSLSNLPALNVNGVRIRAGMYYYW